MRSKSDKYGEVIRVYSHYAGNSRFDGYAVLTPDGKLMPVTQPKYPPTKRGHWCMTDFKLSQDETTSEWSALISVIDCADQSEVKHFDVDLRLKQRPYARERAQAEAVRLAFECGYKRIVTEDEITWKKPRILT